MKHPVRNMILVAAAWFVLAAFVIFRCVTSTQGSLDVIFAAWLGGVVSVLCVHLILLLRRLSKRQTATQSLK